MGKAKLQAELGVNKEKAGELIRKISYRSSFCKTTYKICHEQSPLDRGQIRTLLGRLCRFLFMGTKSIWNS